MPSEIAGPKSLTPELAYKVGYRDKLDRKKKMPYNHDMEDLQFLNKAKALEFIRAKFQKYSGHYILR
jgi:hypothetical protein